jgi:type VI protein secretion system component VasF
LAKRSNAREKGARRTATTTEATKERASPDAAKPAGRADKRAAAVAQGLDALDLWLDDLLRQGLATVETQPATFWERQAARMVDAQAPGIAARLQEDVRQAIGWTLKEEDVLAGGEVVADAGRGGCSSVSSSRRARSGATISE